MNFAALAAFLACAKDVVPLREVARGDRRGGVLALRHDVDSRFEKAMRLAVWEKEHHYRASYFLLPSANYYCHRSELYEGMHRLVALGHEVGLHIDVVAQTWDRGPHLDKAADLLREQLADLRAQGFDIVGTSAHGTPSLRELIERSNLAVYDWAPPQWFGLEYEAYFLHGERSNYISDVRTSRWEFTPDDVTFALIHPGRWEVP